VADALMMAVWRRGKPVELLHHSDQGSQGEFNPSSQHFLIGGVDGYQKAWSRSSRTCKDAVARATAGAASIGAAAVLAGDRRRILERRSSAEGGSVAGGWFEMVSGVWRHAAIAS
jgi:transposase InsO family protein